MEDNNIEKPKPTEIIDDESKELEQLASKDDSEIPSSVYECIITSDIGLESSAIYNNKYLSRGFTTKAKESIPSSENYKHGCCKLNTYNWLDEIPLASDRVLVDIVEVRFKNTRKDFYKTPDDISLEEGDIVAVESSPGHDIGIVSLTGEAVLLQMKKKGFSANNPDIKKVYRKARITDVEKWAQYIEKEDNTIIKTRKITQDLRLDMKMNDVEYQGDGTKAVFYYSAEDRVDFRELIKILAENFRVRIEMRQIGVRQEAARVGGIGSCGRELCCSTWMTSFNSVTTNVARVQQLSINPQKIAGQCSKLKCCLNYEYNSYLQELKSFPDSNYVLRTYKGDGIHQKSDVFKKIMWYSYKDDPSHLYAIPIDKVSEIIKRNEKGKSVKNLEDFAEINQKSTDFDIQMQDDDLSRFDKNLED
jgi:cell fate regulator YaaT (PSP1 superfamily)